MKKNAKKFNLGDVASVFARAARRLESAEDDIERFNAPSECLSVVYRSVWRDVRAELMNRFGLSVLEAEQMIKNRTSERWFYFNLSTGIEDREVLR